ncbi:MAG: alanyl-tRNA editing protein [Candidatus Aenigmarchaeota archaeon]|nr:alanyl-tRNA editing protein [Candidatus Aenigmarchaeota archaeon]
MKLYYQNPYLKETESKILEINENKIVLDKTIFYPQAGGEPGDTGFINNCKVIDTQLIEGKITHVLESRPTFKVGDVVRIVLDWNRRYKLMRMHTALHLLFSVCKEILGESIKCVGSNVGEEKSRIDIFLEGSITSELREKIEKRCNEIISNWEEVKVWWDSEKPAFRWTQIDGLAKLPCGGLHVKNTKEIGSLEIIKRERIGKNKDRLEVVVD